ncbi:MAG TPA: caspase family protein [Pseudomonadales bacterium]
MAKGIALLISVNEVDPSAYGGEWDGKLRFPEADAQAIAEIATGFEKRFLRTKEATTGAVKGEFIRAAEQLEAGDMFFVFYSGHGNTVDDDSGDEFQDSRDESWCLYDGELLDDEIYTLWPKFSAGVRILVMSDSCHSGSITRDGDEDDVMKAMPDDVAKFNVLVDPDRYVRIRREVPTKSGETKARVRLISGCQDWERSWENKKQQHGRFTSAVLEAWGKGRSSDYDEFHRAICSAEALGGKQTPNHSVFGGPNERFDTEEPFAI